MQMYMYTLPPFIGEVLSEERQLMKWVVIFQVGVFWGEIDGWEFPGGGGGGIVWGRIFLEPYSAISKYIEKSKFFVI